jgi:hypothetical protein
MWFFSLRVRPSSYLTYLRYPIVGVEPPRHKPTLLAVRLHVDSTSRAEFVGGRHHLRLHHVSLSLSSSSTATPIRPGYGKRQTPCGFAPHGQPIMRPLPPLRIANRGYARPHRQDAGRTAARAQPTNTRCLCDTPAASPSVSTRLPHSMLQAHLPRETAASLA